MPDTTKLGPPFKRAADKRSEQLLLKLTPAEREAIVAAAGGQPTIWAREVVLRAAKRAAR
ncbi:MAG: hypothetical protein H0T51_07810 [Pirellulales bacterium]|nr:hypothetical protein [Pirellulales bacterium]